MNTVVKSAVLGIMLSAFGLGCQNKVLSENQELVAQNRELQNRIDELQRQRDAAAAMPAPVMANAVPAAAPAPRVIEAPVAPEPVPAAPSPKPDLGNLEVTQDVVAGTTTVNLPSDVFFAPGQAMLLPEAKKSLAKVVSVLKKEYGGKPVRIEGHTDSDPIHKSHWKSNEELSEKRAEAVRDYLVSKGIAESRFSTEGLGATQPKSKTDKAKNRRVELVVMTR